MDGAGVCGACVATLLHHDSHFPVMTIWQRDVRGNNSAITL
jgi:hypothetical protein